MRSGDGYPGVERVGSRTKRLVRAGIVALAAMLLMATTASAATLVGESTTVSLVTGDLTAGSTILRGAATYDSSGHADLSITTAATAGPEIGLSAGLFDVRFEEECSYGGIFFGGAALTPGTLAMKTKGSGAPVQATVLLDSGEIEEVPAARTVSGTTATLSVTGPALANRTFNCALVSASEQKEPVGGVSWMFFPVAPPPPPAIPIPPGPAPTAPPAPKGPPPAALTIAKPKTTTVKAGKWATVKVKVSNTGGSTLPSGSLRVKPAKGVNVKPESQKLPVLAPGASWSLTVKVQLTEKAKAKSTLGLIASGTGATTGSGSLIVKLKE